MKFLNVSFFSVYLEMALQLQLNEPQKVLVTHVTENGKIFLQLDTEDAYSLPELSENIEKAVAQNPSPLPSPQPGQQCCAFSTNDQIWYRAMVTSSQGSEVGVYYVDYGSTESLPLKQISAAGEFFKMPYQSICCRLSDFIPRGGKWDSEVITFLTASLVELELMAVFKSASAQKHPFPLSGETCYDVILSDVETGQTSITETLVGDQLGQFSISTMRIEVGSSVKAGVCFVNSPGKFWIQLDQSNSALEELMADLNDESTLTTLTPLPPSHLSPGVACCCAFSEDEMIYRAEIIEFTSQTKARVSYTDYGNNGVVELANIFALPSRFSKLEALAVQCCLEGVKPVRHSKPDPLIGTIAWRPDACSHFEELTTDTSFDIRFVTELSPEVYSVNIPDATGKSIGKTLADSGFAELRVSDPPERNADQIPVVRQKQQSTPLQKEIETSPSDFKRKTLSPGESFKTLISYAESPSIVWCQRVSTQREFEKMMELLDKSVSKFPAMTDFKPSLPCCALYGPDKTWCRATILEVNASTKQVLVSFVDYGNSDVILFSNVRQLSSELFTLPVQAMCCSMADISQRGGAEWSQEAILAFQEIGANRQLICEVVNVEKEDLPAVKFSDSVMDNRDVGMELVRRGYAKAPLSPPRSHSHVPVPPRSAAKLPPHDEPSNEEEYFTTSSFKLSYNKLKLAPAHIFDVTVSHVESFLEFYCQLQSDSDKLASLMDEIEVHCNYLEAVQCSTLNVGTPVLAQFSADGGWYRALINARPGSGGVCPLTFVDYGNSEEVEIANILQIPSKFISLPTQAFKCQLYGVSPDHQPTDSDIEAFSAYVLEQNFRLFARSHDKATNEFTVELQTFEKVSVLKILIEDGSIVPPKLLVSASLSPRIPDTPPVSSPRKQESKEPPQKASPQQPKPAVPLPRLPKGTFVDVVVSYWESPSKFHVQLTESYAQLEQLSTDISECYKDGSASLVKPIEGDFCAAKFSEDDLWYRARVVKLTGRDAEISFIDYGNCAVVDVSSLKGLKPEFASPPCVAVPVYLEGVDTSVADSEPVIEQFSSLVTNCVLVGKFSKSLSDYDSPVPILLMDTTKPGSDVNIADVLSSWSSILAETEPRQPRNGIEIPMVTPVLNSPMEATVSYVVNPSEFYCQLSSETTPLESIMNKMYARYEEQSPGAPLISPSGGEYCAVPFTDGSWYRGRVVKIGPPPAESVTVDYIDYGNTEVLEIASLKVLEPEFTSLPVQALKCRLANLQSPSHVEWNGDAIEKFEEAVIEQQVSAIFQEDLGNGCYDVQLQVLGNDISQRLIEAGLARRGLVESGTSGTQSVENERNIAIPALELTQGMRFDIFVTSVVSVKEFYCQILDPEEKLDVLMTDIADHCSVEANSKTPSPQQLKPGDFILAQFSVDEGWYRAKIDKILKNGQSFEAFYIDYGNSEVVTPDRLRAIELRFCQLPVQAVKCSLEGAQYYVFSDEASVPFSDAILNAECEMTCEAIIGEYCGVSLTRKGDGIDVMAFAIQQGMLQPVVTKKSTVNFSSPNTKSVS